MRQKMCCGRCFDGKINVKKKFPLKFKKKKTSNKLRNYKYHKEVMLIHKQDSETSNLFLKNILVQSLLFADFF